MVVGLCRGTNGLTMKTFQEYKMKIRLSTVCYTSTNLKNTDKLFTSGKLNFVDSKFRILNFVGMNV